MAAEVSERKTADRSERVTSGSSPSAKSVESSSLYRSGVESITTPAELALDTAGAIGGSGQADDQNLKSVVTEREAARALSGNIALSLTLLTFVAKHVVVSVEKMVADGPPATLFDQIFDLYDAGFLGREGGSVRLTTKGARLLERLNLT